MASDIAVILVTLLGTIGVIRHGFVINCKPYKALGWMGIGLTITLICELLVGLFIIRGK